MKEGWTKNSGYTEQIKKANQTVYEISQYLRQKDPESIIIFIGDHGPWRIRNFPFELENKELNKTNLAKINENYQSVVDDYFHVFSAIYYPTGFEPPTPHYSSEPLPPLAVSVRIFRQKKRLNNMNRETTSVSMTVILWQLRENLKKLRCFGNLHLTGFKLSQKNKFYKLRFAS